MDTTNTRNTDNTKKEKLLKLLSTKTLLSKPTLKSAKKIHHYFHRNFRFFVPLVMKKCSKILHK